MINRRNIDEWMVRSIENDLTIVEQIQLDAFLQDNPDLISEMEAYRKTVIMLDVTIGFGNKELLKKKIRKIVPLWMKVAASVVLLLAAAWWLKSYISQPDEKLIVNQVISPAVPINKNALVVHTPEKSSVAGTNNNINNSIPPVSPDKKQPMANKKKDALPGEENNPVKENMEEVVTYYSAASLHSIEPLNIKEIIYVPITNKNKDQLNPLAQGSIYTPVVKNEQGKGWKMITAVLKHSGNKELAESVERFSNLRNKKYEVSYSSALLNFNKIIN